MATQKRKLRKKPIRISFEEFLQARQGSGACCAGDDVSMTLAGHMVRQAQSTRPADVLDDLLLQDPAAPVHGVWHHVMVGGLLLACLRNAGCEISEDLIDEALYRGARIPGGACGFMGACGALASASSAYAVLLGSTPVATEAREKLLAFSARMQEKLAKIGGSRCCKKSSYVALEAARETFVEIGFELPAEKFAGRCRFFSMNETCDGELCPYFPNNQRPDTDHA